MVLLLTFLWGATTGAVPMLLIQLLDTTCSRSYTSGLASTCRQHDATQRARPNALVAKKSARICHHPFAASQHSRLFLMLSLFLFPQYHEALRGKVLPKGKKTSAPPCQGAGSVSSGSAITMILPLWLTVFMSALDVPMV